MELRDLYDVNKVPTGKTFVKGEQVPKGYYYLIVAIFIENSNGEFLIQKRVTRKGGEWSTTAGHPKAGENSLEGLYTEVEEELGLSLKEEQPILYNTWVHNDQIFDLYYLKKDIDINNITIQQEEVADVKWASITEIKKLMENKEFHANHYEMFERLLKY